MRNRYFQKRRFIRYILFVGVALVSITVALRGMTLLAHSISSSTAMTELTARLQQVLDKANAKGDVKVDENGGPNLIGESAAQVNEIYAEMQKVREENLARPAEQREIAIQNIQHFLVEASLKGNVTYQSTVLSPYDTAVTEYYVIDRLFALVNPQTNQVMQLAPAPFRIDEEPIQYDTTARYSPAQLEIKARQFIHEQVPSIALDSLSPNYSNKDGTAYFFEWEKSSAERIYVGFTIGGDFLSYLNTLDLVDSSSVNSKLYLPVISGSK